VLSIPAQVAPQLPEAVERIMAREQRILGHCQSTNFSLEELKRLFEAD